MSTRRIAIKCQRKSKRPGVVVNNVNGSIDGKLREKFMARSLVHKWKHGAMQIVSQTESWHEKLLMNRSRILCSPPVHFSSCSTLFAAQNTPREKEMETGKDLVEACNCYIKAKLPCQAPPCRIIFHSNKITKSYKSTRVDSVSVSESVSPQQRIRLSAAPLYISYESES